MNGLTLPLWVVAAAKAAITLLLGQKCVDNQTVNVQVENKSYEMAIASCALLENGHKALAITHCDSKSPLDLTRQLEVWTYVQILKDDHFKRAANQGKFPDWLEFVGGQGIGKYEKNDEVCISNFMRQLLVHNIQPILPIGKKIRLEVVLPQGRQLAMRTSNQAFGVVDGLALIGTQSEVQISASPDQLEDAIQQLRLKCSHPSFDGFMSFVIGENGLDLALKFGLPSKSIIKTGNWLGPLLVAAAEHGVENLLLFGYHGKLVKLAGSIFHTHHHLADARIEILTSIAVREGIPMELVKLIIAANSLENALLALENQDLDVVSRVWNRMAIQVEQRSKEYVSRYLNSSISIGAILFDRRRRIRWSGSTAINHIFSLGLKLKA